MLPITISVCRGSLADFVPREVGSVDELAAVTLTESYSLTSYGRDKHGNFHREIACFQQCCAIGLDFDDGVLTLDGAKELFANHAHVIGTTRSHQIYKGTKPPCDRFRVILFLSSAITDVATFNATWASLATWVPGVDKNAKDAARYFRPGIEVISVKADGLLVDPVTPRPQPPKVQRPASKLADGERGDPSRATWKLIADGVAAGGRNNAVHKAARDFYQNGYEFEEALERILRAPLYDDSDFTEQEATSAVESAYKKAPTHPARVDANQALRDLVASSVYVTDVATGDGFLFNEKTGSSVDIAKLALQELMGRQALAAYRSTNFLFSHMVYEPLTPRALHRSDHGLNKFNVYQPPTWQRDHFYFGGSLPTANSLPEIFDSFLNHLVGGDQKSFDYVLDWLATAIRSRNLCILVALGEEGVGKGVLGEVMAKLVGASNFVKVRDGVLKSQFNAALRNKRIVYIDEVSIGDDEHLNRLKDLANARIEIERKGVDSEYLDNHASYYLSSNSIDAIRPGPGDRRFSAIELTETKLTATPLIKRVDELLSDSTIEQLAGYLLSREIKNDMLVPFRTQKFDAIVEAGLAEWEHEVIFSWLAQQTQGAEVPIKRLQEHLKNTLDMRNPPGRNKLLELTKRFPEYLKFEKKASGQSRVLKIVSVPPKDADDRASAQQDATAKKKPVTPPAIQVVSR